MTLEEPDGSPKAFSARAVSRAEVTWPGDLVELGHSGCTVTLENQHNLNVLALERSQSTRTSQKKRPPKTRLLID